MSAHTSRHSSPGRESVEPSAKRNTYCTVVRSKGQPEKYSVILTLSTRSFNIIFLHYLLHDAEGNSQFLLETCRSQATHVAASGHALITGFCMADGTPSSSTLTLRQGASCSGTERAQMFLTQRWAAFCGELAIVRSCMGWMPLLQVHQADASVDLANYIIT